jgi:hypothetical protein
MHRLVIALVTLIGLTGAFVVGAFLFLSGATTDRAAALAPAGTVVYANVYLQPSAGQQMNLAELIGRLPGFADEASLDEKIDQVAQNLLGGTGIDYRADIEPWLGGQLAVAAWAGDDGQVDEGNVVLIAEVRDRVAAETAVPNLLAADGGDVTTETHAGTELHVAEAGAYAFVGEMLVAGPTADALRAAIDAEAGSSLADRADFRATVDALPPDHLAAVFVDLAAVADAGGGTELTGVSTAGLVVVAERDGLRISGSAPFDVDDAAPSARAAFALGTEASSLVDWMPDETVAELVVFGLRQSLEDAESMLGVTPEGEEVAGFLATARALAAFGLGIDLDADVLPLLDREVAVALTGLDGELPSGQLLLRPSDGDAAAGMLDHLAGRLEAAGATRETVTLDDLDGVEITVLTLPDTGEVAYAVVDGIVVLGFTVEDVGAAIGAHRSGRTLGAAETYRSAFELAGARAGTEAYVDVSAAAALLGLDATLPADARDILGQIGSFALTLPSRDDEIQFHAVLTIDERQPE